LTSVAPPTPFWPRPSERYPGRLPPQADVLVIGGGITGLSVLHHLVRRKRAAIVVEREHIAAGASGRNAGFVLAGVAASYAEAVRTFGRAVAHETWALTSENHDAMIDAVGDQEVGHRRGGSAVLATNKDEARQLEESAQLLREDGFDATWDGSRLVNPGDGEVNPAAVVGALAREAPHGSIHEGVDVTAIEPGQSHVLIRAGDLECRAGVVILATNGYTRQLTGQVAIEPTRGQMLATAPVATRVSDMPTYSNFGYRYWRQLDSGVVLVGGWRDTSPDTEVGYDETPTNAIQRHLDTQLEAMGASEAVTHRWAGTMGFTKSGLPLVGPVEGMHNVYVCGGYNGHGNGFAFLSAKQLVEML
jgi:gamma-glutamylputrescine oxidase